ncbi:MAG: class I SAM-dependent methyltransferase [Planctomycetota bacterium]|nr:class I SAM-dependent methyltransferase [Planctomycetota bacterium]
MSSSSLPADHSPYQATAEWYDAIYAARGRDCTREIDYLSRYWMEDGRTAESRRILDAGCGSGAHFDALSRHGRVTGVDRSSEMLEVAGRKPHARLVQADLRTLDLGSNFEVVVCLFGVCGYLADRSELTTVLGLLGRHLESGGVLLLEPPLLEERYEDPVDVHVETRRGDLLLSRTTTAQRIGSHLELNFEWRAHALEGLPARSRTDRIIREQHRILLLDSDAYLQAATSALGERFEVRIDPEGPCGRGLLVAISRDGVRGSG